ncbi:MAG: transcriptional repressor [Chthonomonadales bacterium]|nr:transcriptional repressor [Chthonomonadales bacterium]
MRRTRQRDAVLRAVAHSHPSAEAVHALVRRDMPRISLATVYRLLGALAAEGAIAALPPADGRPRRFDGDTRPHHHVLCTGCGAVADVPDLRPAPGPAGEIERWTGYRVTGLMVAWHGLCPGCRSASGD